MPDPDQNHLQSVHIPGVRPHRRTWGACLLGEGYETCPGKMPHDLMKPGLSTSEGLSPAHLPLSCFPALLRLMRRVMCIYTIHHMIMWHCEIFITIYEATRPSPPNPHVPCVVTTLTGYPPDTFPAGSNRTGLTTVSVLHTPPQDTLISQLKVCSFWPTSPHLPHLPAPDDHHPTLWY